MEVSNSDKFNLVPEHNSFPSIILIYFANPGLFYILGLFYGGRYIFFNEFYPTFNYVVVGHWAKMD